MTKIDEMIPEQQFIPALVIVIVIGIALQLTGAWMTMLIAGAFGALFVRGYKKAFLLGFLGIGIAWTILFAYLAVTSQAMLVAEFFIGLLELSGLGPVVIVISVLLGALLGGFGAILGRAVFEFVDEFLPSQEESEATEKSAMENEQ